MAAEVLVPTSTIITVNSDNNPDTFVIRTFYDRMLDCDDLYSDFPYVLEGLIGQNNGLKNGVPFLEGELVVTMKSPEYPTSVDVWLNDMGELVVMGADSVDANNYYLDDMGNLIYDNCGCQGNTYVECGYVEQNYVE